MRWNQILLVVISCTVLFAGTVHAQDTTAASRAQRKLIGEGLKAHSAADYQAAIELFRKANESGELNIIWLNLGRALQKNGDCYGARQAFSRALEAPPVPNPAVNLVVEAVEKFRAELQTECPGRLRVVCNHEDVELILEGKDLECGQEIDLAPGSYTVSARWHALSKEQAVEVTVMETSQVEMNFDVPSAGVVNVVDPQTDAGDSGQTYGWIAAGTAGAFVVLGSVAAIQRSETVDAAEDTNSLAEYESLRDDHDGQTTLMWTSFGLAVVSGALAGYLFYWDDQESDSVTWLFSPGHMGLQVRY